MIAAGRSLRDVFSALCKFFEEADPDCSCGVYPIDWSGPIFQYGIAPSLPASHVERIAGLPVSRDVAPCGLVAFENTQVIVEDIKSDPRWRASSYWDHVLGHGLRAVWSTPIRSLEGTVLGTLCIYQRKPAIPTQYHQDLIAHVTHIASIAIERSRAEIALKRSEALLAEGQRLSLTGTFSWHLDTDELKFSEGLCRIFEFDPHAVVTFERVFSRIHPEDMPLLSERMKLVRTGHRPLEQDVRLRMPDDRIKYLRSVGQMIRHQDGRPEYLGAVRDITQRRLAEATLDKMRSELAHVTRVMSLGALTA